MYLQFPSSVSCENIQKVLDNVTTMSPISKCSVLFEFTKESDQQVFEPLLCGYIQYILGGPLKIGGEVTLGIRTYFAPKFAKVGRVRTYFDPPGAHLGRGRPNIFWTWVQTSRYRLRTTF